MSRRVKVLAVAAAAAVLLIVFFSGNAQRMQEQPFYRTTVEAMDSLSKAHSSAAAPAVSSLRSAVTPGATEPDSPPRPSDAAAELEAILKRAPVIVFSKSYCPYSAKAKRILLETYSIVPPPHVVELDQHPLGHELQAVLAETTGRRTVPNVMVLGKSIGGGDDMAALDETGELAATLKRLAGKQIVQISRP